MARWIFDTEPFPTVLWEIISGTIGLVQFLEILLNSFRDFSSISGGKIYEVFPLTHFHM
jgi:hypothetical protein